MKLQILVFVSSSIYLVSSSELNVASYNLWNVMFNWEVRKHGIAEMIKETQPDVIAFQEVRIYADESRDQLSDLQALLPEYRWKIFKEANAVSMPKAAVWKGWEREGIGILSRRPITYFSMHTLPYVKGPDTNKRVFLLARIFVNQDVSIPVIAVHLSYDRQQQCGNAKAIIQHLTENGIEYAIVLGDFNTYNDFEWPVKLFTSLNKNSKRACHIDRLAGLSQDSITFLDVQQKTNSKGLTFSNMPTPGYESRPDRILVTSNIEPVSFSMAGNGTYYRTHFRHRIVMSRLNTLLYNSYLSFMGQTGFPCFHDCGPRGKCRCGVCVKIKDSNTESCDLPNCMECRSSMFIYAIFFTVVSVTVAIHFFYSILCLLLGGADFQGEAVFAILGCNCCLCNPNNFKSPNFNSRKFKILRGLRKWPLFRMPPFVLLFSSIILGLILTYIAHHIFVDVLDTVHSVMDEEFYPSDHMMLIAKLNIQKIGS